MTRSAHDANGDSRAVTRHSRWVLWQQAKRQGGSREASELLFDRLLIEHGYEQDTDVRF